MKSKIIVGVLVLSILTVGGVVYINNNKGKSNKQGTSEMLTEELVVKGTIDNIEASEEGEVITVDNIKILVHASTNIFKDGLLLEVSDLNKGQSVEVYSDGVQSDILNGLRVEILE